jgi:hypothetical protein
MLRKPRAYRLATQHRVAVILGVVALAGFAGRAVCAEPSHPDFPSDAPVPYQPAVDGEPAPRSIQAPALVPPSVQGASPPPAPTKWYGYQIMLSDVASVAFLYGGGQWGAVGLYASVPAVIHVVNGRYGLAVASPLLRLVLPLAGALVGAKMESCGQQDEFCGLGGAVAGLAVGAAVAMIVDWSLAWTPVSAAPSSPSQPVPERHARSARSPHITLTSAGVVPTNDGARLVLGGRF